MDTWSVHTTSNSDDTVRIQSSIVKSIIKCVVLVVLGVHCCLQNILRLLGGINHMCSVKGG